MEYLLLKDGTLEVLDVELDASEILKLVLERDADAYYWRLKDYHDTWYRVDTYTHYVPRWKGQFAMRALEVPDIIKLAAMLQ